MPRILVGRRSVGHVFMAGRLVFPGGRLDPSDFALAPAFDLSRAALDRLRSGVRARFTDRRAVALALAAIRETFEETGVMIGRPDAAFRSERAVWRNFAEKGIRPDLASLSPIARAITPPRQVRRFDTRFFAVDAAAIAWAQPFEERPTDEFDLVAWMGLDELLEQDLHPITRRIADELGQRLTAGTLSDASVPMPVFRHVRGVFGHSFA